MNAVLVIAIVALITAVGLLDDRRKKWKSLYQDMVSKMAVGTQQLTEARQRIVSVVVNWENHRKMLLDSVFAIGRLDTALRNTFPEDKKSIELHSPCSYAAAVLKRQKELLDRREAMDKSLNAFCDYKTLEMLVRRAETMPQINMPKGVKVFTDEIGNVLFSPGAPGMPKRYFAYLYRANKLGINSKDFHVTDKPDFRGVPFAKITFVQDEWLTHGEVIGKLAAAAKSLAQEQPI